MNQKTVAAEGLMTACCNGHAWPLRRDGGGLMIYECSQCGRHIDRMYLLEAWIWDDGGVEAQQRLEPAIIG